MRTRISPALILALSLSSVLAVSGAPQQRQTTAAPGSNGRISLKAARVIDGRGNVVEDAVITVVGSKITAVGRQAASAGPITYDLGSATLMPGMIDVHVHPEYFFGPGGKYGERDVPPEFETRAVDANIRAMLMAGFTTVQSIGSPLDRGLRDRIAAGQLEGPRLLTSLEQIIPKSSDTPDALRQRVRELKKSGADVIKLFASASVRDGGKMNVTEEQIGAVCGEAKAQHLRSLVHAHDSRSIVTSVKAGCSEIEHGFFADDAAIKAMKDAHVYFDPNIGLVLQNYIEHKNQYLGTGNYTEQGFVLMQQTVATLPAMFKKALAAGLRMPMGTDAVAGAHGQNAREIIVRVKDGGQKPMDAIVGATSLSADSLNLGDTIGTIKPGYEADIIAVAGNPLTDITALRNVTFVMKGGKVFRSSSKP
jgi:imidazolonepropionase-like amidohydrolase